MWSGGWLVWSRGCGQEDGGCGLGDVEHSIFGTHPGTTLRRASRPFRGTPDLWNHVGAPVAPAGARATVEFLETRQSRLVRRTRDLAI